MSGSIFDEHDDVALLRYLRLARRFRTFDVDEAFRLALMTAAYYTGTAATRDHLRRAQTLEARWYASLAAGTPDYSVYDDDLFISDVWACWAIYSRKYLCALKAQCHLFHDVRSIADLGCGIGYTTAAWKELLPQTQVYGTQLSSSFQFQVAAAVGQARGFDVVETVQPETDLVFASEYFEHFERPITHLLDILRIARPKMLIVANAFGARSIGHFDTYLEPVSCLDEIVDRSVANTTIGRRFNACLVDHGYEKVKTGFWNDRPAMWRLR